MSLKPKPSFMIASMKTRNSKLATWQQQGKPWWGSPNHLWL